MLYLFMFSVCVNEVLKSLDIFIFTKIICVINAILYAPYPFTFLYVHNKKGTMYIFYKDYLRGRMLFYMQKGQPSRRRASFPLGD